MLAIRMQRTGRKGHAQYRLVVQDSSWTPTSGRVVHRLGSFNPHNKEVKLDKEKAKYYLDNGAQPSARVVSILKDQGVKLPDWVEQPSERKKETKNKEKLRKNQPAKPEAPAEESTEPEEKQTEVQPEEKTEENAEEENK